ncbi:hypothetical protein ACETRX_35635 [Labrys portucalensis]|uniref:Uncharacterized protein n=1 Tax=Labrys neptuniae TaxID=376174 RepID=A0ABV3PMU6_9HYPH|nr:hypothetical protein [Labrys neptuniae]MDT3382327.1 hypothetical protein [Labrys neptuniae]
MTIRVIAAAAGYYVIWPQPGNMRGFGRSPVVAWQITLDDEGLASWSEPVAEGVICSEPYAILCPDGTVQESDSGVFHDKIEDWVRTLPRKITA